MVSYKNLLSLHPQSAQPIYVQLANGLIHLIRSGILKPGTKLPSVRAFAALLDLHPKTIVAAYTEMVAQDWIYSRPRSGMIVSENLPELKPRTFQPKGQTAYRADNASEKTAEKATEKNSERTIQKTTLKATSQFKYVINDGFPDHRLAPFTQLLRHYKTEFYDGTAEKESMLMEVAGSPGLRMALADYVGESRAINIGYKNILLTRGAQMATYIAAALAIKPGDGVMVGDPSYGMASRTFELLGAKLIRIPVDEDGIDVDQIEKACKKKPKLLYVIPHHHHPTTVTLSAARRMKLLSLIREHRFHVIEDDYDYEFHYTHNPILPLASADHGGYVWYIGSLTKNLFPSMRIGYLIAPESVITASSEYKRLLDLRGDLLFENALAALFRNGTMQRHIRKSLKIYQERRDIFCSLLESELGNNVSFKTPAGGMAVWVRFNKPHDLTRISAAASGQGLWMSDGLFYNSLTTQFNGLRMGFASLEEKEMVGIFKILKKVMHI